MVDFQIDKFLNKATTITTKQKDTPYITLKKETNKHNRNNLLADYYKQFTKPDKQKPTSLTQRAKSGQRRKDKLMEEMVPFYL